MASLCSLLRNIQATQTIAQREAQLVDGATFLRDISAVQLALRTRNPGKIALYMPDLYAFSVWLLAAWHTGIPVVLPADRLPATVAQLEAEHIPFIGADDHAHEITWPPSPEMVSFSDLTPDMAAVEVFTSGSTGMPVRIGKTLGQLDREVQALEEVLGKTLFAESVITGTVTTQHLYGLLFRLLWPLSTGRAFDCATIQYPEGLWQYTHLHRVLVSSPAFLKRLPDTLNWAELQHGLDAVFSSGGALPRQAAEQVQSLLGLPVHEIFGSSETGGIAWRTQSDSPWTLLPGVQVRRNATGALEIASPFLHDDQWYTSADQVELTENGFTLLGRADRLVKIEEKRVSLSQIERLLEEMAEIDSARIVVLDGKRIELGAVIVLSPAGLALQAAEGKLGLSRNLRTKLAKSVERIGLPRRWRFVEQLPLNSMGKTTEHALRALFVSRPRFPEVRACETSGNRVQLQLSVLKDIAGFEGHFPQSPILPGVVQLDWVMHFSRIHFPHAGHFNGIDTLKFRQVIQPGELVSLHLLWHPEKMRLDFCYRSGETEHASGRIRFEGTAC